jgi:uncharacterized protein YcnI
MTRNIARISAALFAAAALVAVASPASAHVTVSSTDAAQGGFGKAVFRVPNESDAASVNKVVVTLPAETPFAFVNAGVKPGWTVDVAKEKLDQPTKNGDFELTEAVRTITWTATGDGIPRGQFDEFALSGGPFPEADVIAFSAQESYDDGEVVDWDEQQTGDEEAERPAPTLTLAAASDGDHHGSTAAADGDAADHDDEGIALGTWLGGGALIVAAAALVVALRQNRRRA